MSAGSVQKASRERPRPSSWHPSACWCICGTCFLDFLKDNRLSIANGRYGDKSNDFTYISRKGRSVVDYICFRHDEIEYHRDMKIVRMTELFEKMGMVVVLVAGQLVTGGQQPHELTLIAG